MSRPTGFAGSFLGDGSRIDAATVLECGVCWWVYDPDLGDEVWQIAPGTAFVELPAHWRCPNCDAAPHQFMVLGPSSRNGPRPRPERPAGALALERRVGELLAAYEQVDARMRGLPVYNPALRVEAVGFRRWTEGLLGIVVTPWCMNLTLLTDPAATARLEGSKRTIVLPSGSYELIAGFLVDVGPLETCSLFSPMDDFDDPAVARLVAEHAIEAAMRPPPGDAAAEGATAAPHPDEARSVSRRGFLTGAR